MTRAQGMLAVAALWLAFILIAAFLPPIAQNPDYHQFAEQRTVLGIPHFGDVVSNLPFTVIGIIGLRLVSRRRNHRHVFWDKRELLPWLFIFGGIALVGVGSVYYHWAPDRIRQVLDRLPIAVATMAIVAMMITERVDVTWGVRLLPWLMGFGVVSVFYWHFTEQAGHGDLRLYGMVQVVPMLMIPMMLGWFPERYPGSLYLWGLIGWYALAKVFEYFDDETLALTQGLISGHTMKHLLAAWAVWQLVGYLKERNGDSRLGSQTV